MNVWTLSNAAGSEAGTVADPLDPARDSDDDIVICCREHTA
jgi:hypothetical protein